MHNKMFSSLVDMLETRTNNNPQLPIYTFLNENTSDLQTMTLLELSTQAKAIAFALRKTTKPGDRVIIIYPPGLDLIAAFFGCLYAGVIAVPVYPPSNKELVAKLQYVIQNSGAKEVLTTQEVRSKLSKLRLVKFIANSNLLYKACQRLGVDKKIDKYSQILSWEFEKMQFIATDKLPERYARAWTPLPLTRDDVAFLQYTSGSTNKPKGVIVSHGNLLHNLEAIHKSLQVTEEDCLVSWLPPYHDMGLIGCILETVFGNFRTILMSPLTFLKHPFVWLEAVTHFKATASVAPNFAFDLCVERISDFELAELDLSTLRLLMSGAEPIRTKTIERFTERFKAVGFKKEMFLPSYGLAESTLLVAGVEVQKGIISHHVDKQALSQGKVVLTEQANDKTRTIINCGKAAPGVQIKIVNPDSLAPCAEREVGEIWVKGDSTTKGYWQLEQETKYCFHEQAYLRTGDLGYMDEGSLYVTGRLKDMIIIRGLNYYPHDLEYSLHNIHPDLRTNCCAIFAVEKEDKEELIIVQEVKKEDNPDLEEISRLIRNAIMKDHGISPDVIILADRKSVPKTTSGKIQRSLCKQRYLEGKLNPLFVTKNSNETKQIFNKELQIAQKDKRLSELGFDSIKLVELQQQLATNNNCTIPLDFLLSDPTIKEIEAILDGKLDCQALEEVNLDAEFERYKELSLNLTIAQRQVPEHAFLTGGTGFLGAYLIYELMEQTHWKLTCLVQAGSEVEGKERIQRNLETYNLWNPKMASRIEVVLGNLTKPKLGLSEQVWEALAQDVDLIIHSAAALNFVYSYHRLKDINVLGTRSLLDLAAHRRLKAVHYVSTIGYFMSSDLTEDIVVTEQTILRSNEGIYGGYNQTKWLAERLVLNARNYQIPTSIYRPSLITGHSQSGHWNPDDVMCRIMKGCLKLGVWPQLKAQINCVPVDYVSKSIVQIAKQKPYQDNNLHLTNPKETHVDELFRWLNANGYPLNLVDYQEWTRIFHEKMAQLDPAFAPLRSFFTEKVAAKNDSLFNLYLHPGQARVSGSYSKERMAQLDIHCEPLNESLFNKYLTDLFERGFFSGELSK